MRNPKVSVVVCTYNPEMRRHLLECIDSLRKQTYPVEIICIVDGNKDYWMELREELDINKLYNNPQNMGLSYSKNAGVKQAEGDVVAFIDDDAVPEVNWIEKIIEPYENGAVASGGILVPLWLEKKPEWFPEEFYWMVGATHKGFPEKKTEIRNTFGSNLSFKKDVFDSVGGFREEYGVKGKGQFQGEETELCDRIRKKYGRGVIYNPDAVVYHKVFKHRIKLSFLIKRAFWQGYSKAIIEKESEIREEKSFLKYLLVDRTIVRLKNPVKLAFIWMFIIVIGIGYACAKFTR